MTLMGGQLTDEQLADIKANCLSGDVAIGTATTVLAIIETVEALAAELAAIPQDTVDAANLIAEWRTRAEAAEAERDAVSERLRTRTSKLRKRTSDLETAKSRIAAVEAAIRGMGTDPNHCSGCSIADLVRAALTEPVEPQPREHTPSTLTDEARCLACRLPWPCPDAPGEPQRDTCRHGIIGGCLLDGPSACATCGDKREVPNDLPGSANANLTVPCPSCTPPDPAP